jgi:hypothetical protein
MNKRIVVASLTAAALAVPAAAVGHPGNGKDHETKAGKVHSKAKKAKKVTFVFKGTFTAPGTVVVLSGNSHVRKGGFVGQAVTFDFASAKVVAADANADEKIDVSDVKDGDAVLVQARVVKRTKYLAAADPIVARKIVDKTKPPVEDDDSGEDTASAS